VQSGTSGLEDDNTAVVSRSGLDGFEQRYFAAYESIPKDAFTEQDRSAPSLLANDDGKNRKLHEAYLTSVQQSRTARLRRDTNTTCLATEFELIKPTVRTDRVCEPFSTCGPGQKEVTAPTKVSDRICATVKESVVKEYSVHVGRKSEAHPYFTYGADEGFYITAGDSVKKEAPAVRISRREGYRFATDGLADPDDFMLTLDAVGGPDANAYTTGVNAGTGSLFFTPGPDTPSVMYYHSRTKKHMGWRILVSDPKFEQIYTGSGDSHNRAGSRRFATSYSTKARLFTQTTSVKDSNVVSTMSACKSLCASSAACQGVYLYKTAESLICYGLDDVSGSSQETNVFSFSVRKIVY
jgi:hypothetical protein